MKLLLAAVLAGTAGIGVVGQSPSANLQSASAAGSGGSCARVQTRQLASWSNEDLAKRLFVLHFYGSSATVVTEAELRANKLLYGVGTPAEIVARWKPAGIILLGANPQDGANASLPTRNIVNAQLLAALSSEVRKGGNDPSLLIGIDQEGGRVDRLRPIYGRTATAKALGPDGRSVSKFFAQTALQLRRVGVNVNFAPVADVVPADQTDRAVIGDRSFGSDPALVGDRVQRVVVELQSRKIAAVAKHWPGHGSITVDSHLAKATLDFADKKFVDGQLAPFNAAISHKVAGVMVGHLAVPAWDKTGRPATISPEILGRLRTSFCGAIVSDSFWMDGIRSHGDDEELVVQAVQAGIDLVVMPVNVSEAVSRLSAEADRQPLFRKRLEESVARIEQLRVTYRVG